MIPLDVPGIYGIFCLPTGKCYIGSSVNIYARCREHRWRLERGGHHSILFQRAWQKHGKESFRAVVLEQCEQKILPSAEQKWFETFQSFNPQYGFNVLSDSDIGEALRGRPLSRIHRERLSQAGRGKHKSLETRARMREAALERKAWLRFPSHLETSRMKREEAKQRIRNLNGQFL